LCPTGFYWPWQQVFWGSFFVSVGFSIFFPAIAGTAAVCLFRWSITLGGWALFGS